MILVFSTFVLFKRGPLTSRVNFPLTEVVKLDGLAGLVESSVNEFKSLPTED